MAIVLKPVSGESKGLVVFTHKERRFLDENAPVLGDEIRRLRRHFVVLMHWGSHFEKPPLLPAVDAHVCRDSAVVFPDPAVRRIPMNSAMFTPEYFRPRNLEKQWDVISVTRPLRQKRTGELFACLRHLFDRRPRTTAFVLSVGPAAMDDPRYENDLYERYVAMFNEAERERFTFLSVRSKAMFPFSRRDIAFFYNASRVFTLFSDMEGESRVIKEALMCGLPVLVKRHLLGGGRDFLTDENSALFSNAEDGAERLCDMLDRPDRFRVDARAIADEVGEVANVPRFEAAVRALYAELGVPFTGTLDTVDLSRKLPAHVELLPPMLRGPGTDDLRSAEAMVRFIRGIVGGVRFEDVPIGGREHLLLAAHDRITTARDFVERARARLGRR